MKKWKIDPLGFSVLRIPYLPENTTDVLAPHDENVDCKESISQSLQALIKLCQNQDIVQAIGIASENLAKKITSLTDELTQENLKLAASIYKYIARMSTRATPFGAFSGVMLVNNSKQTKVDLATEQQLYLRIDNSCVMEIAHRAEQQAIRTNNKNLKVRKNSSLSKIGREFRFVSKTTINLTNDFKLDSVETSKAIENVLMHASNWITINDLTHELSEAYLEAEPEQLTEFIFNLLKNQLLESNLMIVVSSNNSFETLYQRCKQSNISESITKPMQQILKLLESVKSIQAVGAKQNLPKVKQILMEMLPDFELNRWLHVDSFRTVDGMSIGEDKTAPLLKTINAIAPFFWKKNTVIDEFTQNFISVYGDAKVPLLEALDVDNGIPFGQVREGRSPLLKGVVLESGKHDFSALWEPLDQYIMQQVLNAVAENRKVVYINSKHIEKYQFFLPEPKHHFDDTVAVHGVFLEGDQGAPLYLLKTVSGPSSLNLLGRFCCGDENLAKACKKIAHEEQNNNPEALLAEIIHVPQAITANISGRPSLRDFEIVYGPGDSGLADDQQLKCEDLCLQVKAGRLLLFSRKLNKEIKPRLASAHNTGGLNLPVYQFLHAMQGINGWVGGISLSQVFTTLPYLPEIRIDNLIISERRWLFNKLEIDELHTHPSIEQKLSAFNAMRTQKLITRYVTLTEGDNTLEFDLDQAFSVLTLINEVKNKKMATLTASCRGRTDQSFQQNGAIYRQEFVIPCRMKTDKNRPTAVSADIESLDVHQMKKITSLPGEKWTYVKIYTGEAGADKLMAEQIAPLANELIKNKVIEQWFFIRYADPSPHLRVRFKLTQDYNTQQLNESLYKLLRVAYQEGAIKKIVEDCYLPEIVRYGGPKILPVCERLFHLNSVVVADIIGSSLSCPNTDELRWKMCLHLAWKLTMSVCDSLPQMEQFYKNTAAAYDLEFGHSQSIKKQVSENYRLAMPDVSGCLKPGFYAPSNDHLKTVILPAYTQAAKQLKALCLSEKIDVFGIIQSLIHMDCNRMFVINPRANEWILYHYLARYTRTVIARNFKPGVDVVAGFV